MTATPLPTTTNATRVAMAPEPSDPDHLFPAGGPVPPGDLIGRRVTVSSLVEGLRRFRHQALTGTPSSGKTSVARAATARLGELGWDVVSIDLFHIPDRATLVTELAAAAGRDTPDPSGRMHPPATIGEAVGAIRRRAEASNRRTVLLVDGLHEVLTTKLFGDTRSLLDELRHVLDGPSGLVGCFVGSVPHRMHELFRTGSGPLGALAPLTTLGPIAPDEWAEGLRPRFRRAGHTITDPALHHLVTSVGGNPHSTMVVAGAATRLATENRTPVIDRELVETALRTAWQSQRTAHRTELRRLRTLGKHTLRIAVRVASARSPYEGLPPAVARQTLRLLETAGIVDHLRDGVWRVADPLFAAFLLETVVTPPGATGTTGSDRHGPPSRLTPPKTELAGRHRPASPNPPTAGQ